MFSHKGSAKMMIGPTGSHIVGKIIPTAVGYKALCVYRHKNEELVRIRWFFSRKSADFYVNQFFALHDRAFKKTLTIVGGDY